MAFLPLAVAAAFLLSSGPSARADVSAFTGLWYDDTGRGAVAIAPCGAEVCGHIYWLRNPLSPEGKPLRDAYNPEPGSRGRPICGLQVLGQLRPQRDGSLDQGWVYDPNVGQSYNVELRLESADRLAVRGYKGLKLLGRTLTWTRAPADLPPCEPPAPASRG